MNNHRLWSIVNESLRPIQWALRYIAYGANICYLIISYNLYAFSRPSSLIRFESYGTVQFNTRPHIYPKTIHFHFLAVQSSSFGPKTAYFRLDTNKGQGQSCAIVSYAIESLKAHQIYQHSLNFIYIRIFLKCRLYRSKHVVPILISDFI